MAVLVEFDPTSEDAANSPLEIWSTATYAVTAFDSPAPSPRPQWASSVDTEGSLLSSVTHENRQINLTIEVMSAAGLRVLQAKFAKVAREAATAKLTFPNSEVMVFDLLMGDSFAPQLDIVYYVNSGAFCVVEVALTAKPYGRGVPVSATITGSPATSKAPLVFTIPAVTGDVPALASLRVSNATAEKTWLAWGQQNRNYDAAATAALFLEAESQTAVSGALNAGPAGASGGGANKVMRHTSIGTTAATTFVTLPGGSNPTHVGSFRVYARVQAATANTGLVQARLGWLPDLRSGTPIETDRGWVPIADSAGSAIEGSWVIVDLGMVTIPRVRLGAQGWYAGAEVIATTSGNQLDWDWLALVPVDDGSGLMVSPSYGISSTDAVDISDKGVLASKSSVAVWFTPNYAGDYLKIPPLRTTRFIVIFTGPAALTGNCSSELADAVNIDAISATLTYTPRYLVVPSP